MRYAPYGQATYGTAVYAGPDGQAAPVLAVPLVAGIGWLAWHLVRPLLRRERSD